MPQPTFVYPIYVKYWRKFIRQISLKLNAIYWLKTEYVLNMRRQIYWEFRRPSVSVHLMDQSSNKSNKWMKLAHYTYQSSMHTVHQLILLCAVWLLFYLCVCTNIKFWSRFKLFTNIYWIVTKSGNTTNKTVKWQRWRRATKLKIFSTRIYTN